MSERNRDNPSLTKTIARFAQEFSQPPEDLLPSEIDDQKSEDSLLSLYHLLGLPDEEKVLSHAQEELQLWGTEKPPAGALRQFLFSLNLYLDQVNRGQHQDLQKFISSTRARTPEDRIKRGAELGEQLDQWLSRKFSRFPGARVHHQRLLLGGLINEYLAVEEIDDNETYLREKGKYIMGINRVYQRLSQSGKKISLDKVSGVLKSTSRILSPAPELSSR